MDKQTQLLKEDLVRDAQGNVISATRKELTEEDEKIKERKEKVVTVCESCGSFITDPEEVGPRCSVCGRQTCKKCVARCQTCGKYLCQEHRLGFASKGITVCRECMIQHVNRRRFNDKRELRKQALKEILDVEDARWKRIKNGREPQSGKPSIPGRKTVKRLNSKLKGGETYE